jgi:hypothetical protein
VKIPKPELLYHYCCVHSAVGIREDGELFCAEDVLRRKGSDKHVPHPNGYVVWLTDMEPPPLREPLGLTIHNLKCDRITHCFVVEFDPSRMEWYMTFRRRHPEMRELEDEPGCMPRHWWAARGPIPVLREITKEGRSI